MKFKAFLAAALLSAAASLTAHAQTTFTPNDLFLWIGDVTAASSYVVDIGQSFDYTKNFTIAIPALNADMTKLSGTGWATNINTYFAIVGGTIGSSTTEKLVLSNSQNTPYNFTRTSESSVAQSINSIVNGWAGNSSSGSGLTGSNSQALEEVNASSNSMQGFIANGFNSFCSNNQAEGPVYNTSTSQPATLNLDLLISSSPSLSAPGYALGTFQVDAANNQLIFKTASIPEPSAAAGCIVGAATICFALRRRRRTQAD